MAATDSALTPEQVIDGQLAALAGYKRAMVPVKVALKRLGMRGNRGLDHLADLESLGWIETATEPTVSIILSSRGAERLGLELVPLSEDDPLSCLWVSRGSKFKPKGSTGTETPLTDVGDGKNGWAFARNVKATDIGECNGWWKPTLLLGTGRINWTPAIESTPLPGTVCSTCRGSLPKGHDAICLACLRVPAWVEKKLRPVHRPKSRIPLARPAPCCLPKAVTKPGGLGRVVAKAVKASAWHVKNVAQGFRLGPPPPKRVAV
jgi:hypothetical protein